MEADGMQVYGPDRSGAAQTGLIAINGMIPIKSNSQPKVPHCLRIPAMMVPLVRAV
jgi:hypothetical protein